MVEGRGGERRKVEGGEGGGLIGQSIILMEPLLVSSALSLAMLGYNKHNRTLTATKTYLQGYTDDR